ncbi:ATP-binding protein [Kibdelosporangium aridum]|uniref:ATP-binding protein n=1 Tax=Kibdelosporangium aridum TaxID=2030 RepID=UPI0035F07358
MDNLPGEMTSFIGRRRETAQAVRLLRRARLVTLTGVAGVGKTRLALRVAAQVREAFPDGVWLVELAALIDDTLLPQTVADVLGVQQRRTVPALDTLADHLADKRLLLVLVLVLDNCEHLLDSCAMLTSQLLAAAPGLRVLATSRQALGTPGEHLLEVPPLSVPDPEQPMVPRTIARGEAVRLFAERAALARPGFAVTTGNRATIWRMCRRLDGIPLAIELAALRVRAIPVAEILTGLDDYLGFLAAGSRVAVPRVQTLRAAIDWRAEQEWLGPNEQAWFTRLRREHPNLRAALEFCLTEPGQARAGLEITAALFHYWVRSCTHTEGRYWLDRALELAPEPSPLRAKALWTSGHIALMQADTATALSQLEQARALAHRLGDELALAHITLDFGVAAFIQNDHQHAVTLIEDALAHHQMLDNPAGVWLALVYLALTAAALGGPDRAADFGEECLALCDSRGASPSRIYPLWVLSFARWLSGDRQQAARLIRKGLPAARQFDDRWALAHHLETLAWIAGADGRHARATRLLGAAHTIWRSTGTPQSGPRYLASSHDRCEQQVRDALGDEQFTTAFQHGTRFTPDQAIDYALETSEPTTAAQPAPPSHDRWPP